MTTTNKKQTIAIDMDGVLASVEPQLIKYYNKFYKASLTLDDIQGLASKEAFPLDATDRLMVNSKGFFRDLDVMDGAIDAVKQLMEKYEVYIVSAATEFPLSLFEKMEWLKEYFPFISWRNIVLCGDKSIINTDYMIDDHSKNLDFFAGKTIMFHAHHNIHQNHHFRVTNWKEVLDYFEKE